MFDLPNVGFAEVLLEDGGSGRGEVGVVDSKHRSPPLSLVLHSSSGQLVMSFGVGR